MALDLISLIRIVYSFGLLSLAVGCGRTITATAIHALPPSACNSFDFVHELKLIPSSSSLTFFRKQCLRQALLPISARTCRFRPGRFVSSFSSDSIWRKHIRTPTERLLFPSGNPYIVTGMNVIFFVIEPRLSYRELHRQPHTPSPSSQSSLPPSDSLPFL